jgi:hypothetical protein
VRLATNEEKALIATPGSELLGIKDMIEGGTFRSSQYLDLLSQAYPPQEHEVVAQRDLASSASASPHSASESLPLPHASEETSAEQAKTTESGRAETGLKEPSNEESQGDSTGDHSSASQPAVDDALSKEPAETQSSYGPVRRMRVPSKGGPLTMFRPAAMRHDDFVEVMREVVPQLIDDAVQQEDQNMSAASKRPAEIPAEEPASKVSRTAENIAMVQHAIAYVESACCNQQESHDLWNTFKNTQDNAIEVFVNQYFQKRAQKEISASKNEPMLQARVDQAKVSEWQTLVDKNAVRVLSAKESRWVRKHRSDRVMGSRFVIVKKPEEDIRS